MAVWKQLELACGVSVPAARPSIVAVSGTPQRIRPCAVTLNAHDVTGLPRVMVLSALKKLLPSTVVAIFPDDGAGEDVGDELGVVVALGEGEELEVGFGLTALEAVVLVEVEVFVV
ncbi:MAG: hypothetical protein ACXVIA_05900 [Halobacteriota archaeon]